ncbi:hypothetical protein GCM10009700_35100 [Brevibacterium sanguinis]
MLVPSNGLKKSLASAAIRMNENLFAPNGEPVFTYLREERGLTEETINKYRLGVVDASDEEYGNLAGYVSIPFITPTSRTDWHLNFTDLRFRRGPDMPDSKPKYRTLPGREPRLYGTTTLANPGEYVVLVEGEIDCLTLLQCGIPAVGLSGVSAWKPYYRNVFNGFEKVIIIADNDEPRDGEKVGVGERFAGEIAKQVPNPKVVLIPEGKDTNGFFMLNGAAELRNLIGV